MSKCRLYFLMACSLIKLITKGNLWSFILPRFFAQKCFLAYCQEEYII